MNNISREDFLILICAIYFALFVGGLLIAYLNDKLN